MKTILFAVIFFSFIAHGDEASDRKLIRKVISKNIAKLTPCYNQRLDDGLKAEGKLTVAWDIDDTGIPKNFSEKNNELNDRKLYECVVGEMKTWKFPPAPKGELSNMRYPFAFSKP